MWLPEATQVTGLVAGPIPFWLLHWFWRSKLGFSCLSSKQLIHGTVSLAQHICILQDLCTLNVVLIQCPCPLRRDQVSYCHWEQLP